MADKPNLPDGAVFKVTELVPCHHADLGISSLDDLRNTGPMLCRYRPEFKYQVTGLNRNFIQVMVAAGKAVVIGVERPRRRSAVVNVG